MISKAHSIKGYILVEKIGEGSFGEVFIATDSKGRRVALKIVKPLSDGEKNRERIALDFYIRTKEKNRKGIIEILDCGRTESGAVFYTMPLAQKTLQDVIKEKLETGTWFLIQEIRKMCESLFDALEFLESEKLVHRDIKPTNILLIDGKLVLSDIGLLEIEDDGTSRYGTENYRAPEYFKGNPDFWSVACVIFFILTGQSPEFWQSPSNWKSPLGEEEMSREEILEYARLRAVIFNRATSHRAIDLFRSAKEFKEEILDITSSQNRKFLQKKYFAFAIVLMILLGAIFFKFFVGEKQPETQAQIASVAETKSPTQIKELNAYTLNQISANGFITERGEEILSFANWRREMLKTENRIDFAKQTLKLIIATANPFAITNKNLTPFNFKHLQNEKVFALLENKKKLYAKRSIGNYIAYINSIFYGDKSSLIAPKNFSQNKIKIYPLSYEAFLENRKNLAQFGYKFALKKHPNLGVRISKKVKSFEEALAERDTNFEDASISLMKQVDELLEKYSNEKGYAEYLKILKSEIAKIPELEFTD